MSMEQITALPISDLADDQSHLWLWATNTFLPPARIDPDLELSVYAGHNLGEALRRRPVVGVAYAVFAPCLPGKVQVQEKPLPNVIFGPRADTVRSLLRLMN